MTKYEPSGFSEERHRVTSYVDVRKGDIIHFKGLGIYLSVQDIGQDGSLFIKTSYEGGGKKDLSDLEIRKRQIKWIDQIRIQNQHHRGRSRSLIHLRFETAHYNSDWVRYRPGGR